MLFKKPIVVGIHGFGQRREEEFKNLKKELKKKGYKFKSVNLFDTNDLDDNMWENWIIKAKTLINDVAEKNDVILVGFSMGGVIASYLSNEVRVKKLILISPAFEYLNIQNIKEYVIKAFSNKKSTMPSSFTNAFSNVISKFKDSVEDIKIPTLIIHGENDKVIHYSSSQKAIKKIKINKKALIIINNGNHKILDDKIEGSIAINNIISFIKGNILN